MPKGLTIQALIEDLLRHPGSITDADGPQLRRFWSAICEQVQQALFAKKAILIPEFGQFTFKRDGLGCYHPLFQLLPAYCQQNYLAAKQTEGTGCTIVNGVVMTVPLNLASLTLTSGLQRHSASCILKEITRRAGQFAFMGNPVSLDFGVAVVHFRSQRYWATWAPAFMDMVKRFGKQTAGTTPSPAPVPGNQDAARSVSHTPKDGAEPKPTGGVPPNVVAEVASEAKSVLSAASGASASNGKVPSKCSSKASSRIRAVAAVQERREQAKEESAPLSIQGSQALKPQLSSAASESPAENIKSLATADEVGLSDLPERLEVTSIRSKAQTNNPYLQQRQAKAARRLEKKLRSGALEGWDAQMKEKQTMLQKEKEEEMQLHRLLMDSMEQEEKQEKERRQGRRQRRKNDNKANEQLMRMRSQSPGAYEMGTIFKHVDGSPSRQVDLQFLKQQIDTQKEVLRNERRQEVQIERQYIEEELQQVKQRENIEKQRKQQLKQQLAAALHEQINSKAAMKDRPGHYNDADDPGGNFFFGLKQPEDVKVATLRERQERTTLRHRFWEESLKIYAAREADRKRAAAEELAKDLTRANEDRQRYLDDKAQRQISKMEQQSAMRAAWDGQVEQKQQNPAKDARLGDNWYQPQCKWKNESSDDEGSL